MNTDEERAKFEAWWRTEGKTHSQPKENCYRAWQARATHDEALRKDAVDNAIFEAGWRTAAKWANRDDLYADTGSAAYLRDRELVLSELRRLLDAALASPAGSGGMA